MKKKFLVRAVCAFSVMMACTACRVTLETDLQNEYLQSSRRSVVSQMVLVATQETPEGETKTALSGSQVVWESGDQIMVFNATHSEGVIFTLNNGSIGQAVGEFTGEAILDEGPFYAIYPAAVAGTLSTGGVVSIDIPQVQILKAGNFGKGANIAMAKVDNLSDPLHFKNVLGAVCIQLSSSITASRIRIQTKWTEPLWGSGTVQMVEDVPSLSLNAGTVDNQIVEATGSATGTAFYLMLPPDALAKGFITQVAVGENAMLKEAPASASNKIARSGIVAMPAFGFANQLPAAFLNISDAPFGYWADMTQTFTFVKATSQYATKVEESNRTFRIQDFSTGQMFSFVMPKTLALGLDGSYLTTLESVVGSTYTAPASAGSFRMVQKTSKAGWFVNGNNTKGFIISLED